MKYGPEVHVPKPVRKDDLLRSIHRALRARQGRQDDVPAREREARLRHAQKMEVLGRLASGVAHDLNNLITVMVGYSEILLQNTDPIDPMRPDLIEIQKAGDRAVALTRQLLAFSRKQMPEPTLLDLNSLVGNMEQLLRRLIRENIELVTTLQPGLGLVKGDPGQVEQVLMNLVLNARDAMPTGGRLTVATSTVHVEAGAEDPVPAPGPYVVLEVCDNGCGMDETTQAHLFEPFYTTKDPGKGTGLGLCIVWDIVSQHGGGIAVASVPGCGTTFRIYLPQVAADPVATSSEPPLPESAPAWETVLVVEDNDNIRSLIREILRRNGYTVLEARHGDEAVAVCEEHEGPVHLLVCDVILPRSSARDLAHRLVPRCPGLKVLYMSGYGPSELEASGLLVPQAPFLEKPFLPEVFARKVREVLTS